MDDLEELGFFEEEPEWITANRNRFTETPELRCHKFNPAFLDGWVTLDSDSSTNLSDLISGEEPMALDQFFSLPKRSILEKMDIEGLINYDSPDWMLVSPASNAGRKYWDFEEEEVVRRFIGAYPDSKAVPREAWEVLARKLGRSVCSLKNKAMQLKRGKDKARVPRRRPQHKPLSELIKQALMSMPDQTGTKAEVISRLQSMIEAPIDSRFKSSVSEAISRYCIKLPGKFSLVPEVVSRPAEQCESMVDFIVWALSWSPALTLCELKQQIKVKFARWLNEQVNADSKLCIWEKTLLKKLRVCPWIDRSCADTKYKLA
jgi:hypothetical protein